MTLLTSKGVTIWQLCLCDVNVDNIYVMSVCVCVCVDAIQRRQSVYCGYS